MANLRTSMDSAFYDLNIATPQTLHGSARSVPGEPVPLDGAPASKLLRLEQLSLLTPGFPLGLIPSYAPPLSSSSSQKESGSLSLQTLWLRQPAENWLVGLVGQVRPRQLLSSIQEASRSGPKAGRFKRVLKTFLDKSLYTFGLSSQLELTPSTSVLLTTEKDFQDNNSRTKAILHHKLPDHDITLEAAWPELFVDRNGNYWNVPETLSLDCSSLIFPSGLRYRVGIHKNGGSPVAVDSSMDGQPPDSLRPGICAKAAFSYEKRKDLWRNPETEKDMVKVKSRIGNVRVSAYDSRMKEPHATISGILGGTCDAWLSGNNLDNTNVKRNQFGGDLFGSLSFAVQHGKFRKRFGDLSRLDARLDLSSASILNKSSSVSPQLNLILQQQVLGPLVFRVNSKVSFGGGPHVEDLTYSLNYALRYLESGKVVAWYSPKRNEGMVEVRFYEF